jgi:hypothetical protein
VRARFGPLELVSAIFIKIKYSLLHSLGNKLTLAEALIFTFLMVKYTHGQICVVSLQLITSNITGGIVKT